MVTTKDFRAGYVGIVGRPNTGKSTLLNKFLDFKLSIVTNKPQTTRKKVLGIMNNRKYQIIFMDTPGLIEPKYNLQVIMMSYIQSTLMDADVIVYIVDVTSPVYDFRELETKILKTEKPIVLALNKIDLIQKDRLLILIDKYSKFFDFKAFVPISALKSNGLDKLLDEIVTELPYHPPFFPPDSLTDEPERFFVSEIIREKIFQLYGQEIPYACHVAVEEYKERSKSKDYIRAVIYVDQVSQKGILIGRKGRAIKKVGELARHEIENFLGKPVFLELYVKVLLDWRKKTSKLKDLGY